MEIVYSIMINYAVSGKTLKLKIITGVRAGGEINDTIFKNGQAEDLCFGY